MKKSRKDDPVMYYNSVLFCNANAPQAAVLLFQHWFSANHNKTFNHAKVRFKKWELMRNGERLAEEKVDIEPLLTFKL